MEFLNTTTTDQNLTTEQGQNDTNPETAGLSSNQTRLIYIIGLSIVLPTGVLANFLAFATMQRKRLRAFTTCTYLAFIAITDNITLMFVGGNFLFKMITGVTISTLFRGGCGLLYFLLGFGGQSSAWLLVAVTADR